MRDLGAARSPPLSTVSRMLQPLPPATRHVLRGGAAVRTAAEAALGIAIPFVACRAAASGERAALWLGPDEWLLLAPEAQATAVAAALGSWVTGEVAFLRGMMVSSYLVETKL